MINAFADYGSTVIIENSIVLANFTQIYTSYKYLCENDGFSRFLLYDK